MSILFKGNLEEGNYTLIKSTDGWVLKGETSYVGFNFADRKTEPKPCEWCKFSDGENCFSQEPCKVMLYFKTEPQTDKDFKVTYTCSFTECDNFKNFGFGEKCIECKRKQSEAKHKDEPQTDCTEALTLLWIKNMVTDEEFYRIDARLKVMTQTERSE